jgi:GAF domain-containing protein
MRRRSRASSKLAKARSRKAKALKAVRHSSSPVAGQETEATRFHRERDEALEQLSATSEVLKVISASAGNLEPVFGAMLENATRICEATSGLLVRAESDRFRIVASLRQRADIENMKHRTFKFGPSTPIGRAVRTRQVVHVANLSKDLAYLEREPLAVWAVERANVRTVLVIPMLKREELVGVFGLEREEVRPFTDKQIALVQTFASQAVIAIENTRLLNELRQRTDDLSEALQQQTATSEVLKVVSSSPGDLRPVFQAMLESATRICEAKFGTLYRFDGQMFHLAAQVGTPPELAEFQRQRGPFLPLPGGRLDRIMRTKQVSYTADLAVEVVPEPPAKLGDARSFIGVPMLKDDALIGTINIYRHEVRPFTEKQIELLRNFAAQAVIAIENARLLNELRESLEQQTASSDVLRVISSSPGELAPVFQSMLENAVHICQASFGNLLLYEDGAFRHVALFNAPKAWAAEQQRDPVAPRRSARFLYRELIRNRLLILPILPLKILMSRSEESLALELF